ncbi:MAG: AraC-like DNA-binding protein [Myxococcota bacterium]|jgi:AraC-like DNA-binding protein
MGAETTDALTLILRSLRLESGLISRGRFRVPWTIHTNAVPYAIFHAVLEGECALQRDGDVGAVRLQPGELVMVTAGDGHTVSDGSGAPAVPITSLPREVEGGLAVVQHGGEGALSRVLCGRFQLDPAVRRGLIGHLPPLIVIRKQQARVVEWLETTLQLIAYELDNRRPGSDEILSRLTDILFVQVIRTYALSLKPGEGGWLGAVHDPQIAQALALMHDHPEQRWTAAGLARQVGMSRTSFYARFQELVGEAPSGYLTRWRMQRARELLRRADLSTAELAEQVGYGSEEAFSRAFRRTVGVSPSEYRRGL